MEQGEKAAVCSAPSGCEVFAGVRLTCLHGQRYATPFEGQDRLEILYCHAGSLECLAGSRRQALCAGDVLICAGSAAVICSRGVSVALELGAAQESMRHILRDLGIDLFALRAAYCGGGQATCLRANQSLTHVFSALCGVPEGIRCGYAKARIPEMLFLLENLCLEGETTARPRSFSPYTVAQTRAVAAWLTQYTEGQDTIAALSSRFCVSQTVLKECFRQTYGESIAAFSRRVRMDKAAELLRDTDESILEVAMRVGYSNGSKFAQAFRAAQGLSPREYRRKMGQKGSNCGGSEWNAGEK